MAKKDQERLTSNPVARAMPVPADGVRLETFIPWALVKRRVNRQVVTPLDAPQEFREEATREKQVRESVQDTALMRALGLAHHWQKLLDSGKFATISEIAKAEGLDATQVRRVMRLALLAPGVVEWLDGDSDIVLELVMRRIWPYDWHEQVRILPDP